MNLILRRPVRLFAPLGLACVLACACSRGRPGPAAAAAAPSPFATISNGKVDVEGGIVEIAARRPGIIRDVLVQEGDVVRRGQILARQEDEEPRLAVASAEAALGQVERQLALSDILITTATRELARLESLVASNLVSKQQLDQARDTLATAEAQRRVQQANVLTAAAQLAQARYTEDLTIIRAPMDGKIIRRYANPGAGASTLNVSDMFDLEPAIPHIIRAEIIENALPSVFVGQEAQIVPEADPTQVATGRVLRIAATFGLRKLKSDKATEATDERVVEVVVSANDTPYLIGQRVMVKFLKKGAHADPPKGP